MEIKDFCFLDKDHNSIQIEIGLGKPIYRKSSKKSEGSAEYERLPGKRCGISWNYNGKTIEKFKAGRAIYGFPSIENGFVVAIYSQTDPEFPSPKNAVIYKSDGSFYLQLQKPELISEIAKERGSVMGYDAPFNLWFDHVHWRIHPESGETITAIKIGFDREWYEWRVLNPQSGELGPFIEAGKF